MFDIARARYNVPVKELYSQIEVWVSALVLGYSFRELIRIVQVHVVYNLLTLRFIQLYQRYCPMTERPT